MRIFRPQGAGNVPRTHSTIEGGWQLPPAHGGVLRRTKMRVLARNAVIGCLQEKFLTDFHVNEPITGKRQLNKGAAT
jgi:hypothetical protein